MDWVNTAAKLFATEKPAHFTDFTHCEECEEHDQTLVNSDIETIGLQELGNPGWDPICFASTEGKKYYMPALIRLSLETMTTDFYFGQLLFHLAYDGAQNDLFVSCTTQQKQFVAAFVEHVILNFAQLDEFAYHQDDALNVYQIWSGKGAA